ncbi:MAG: hypothetical protein Ct9H300mP1_19140 [Planctomycetaceae bacterium]|nr:MAG: hypothetical protein Ct9H300mP1_19140 [Planctomycetaceae bacterium]
MPVVSFFPKKAKYSGLAVVWVDGRGKGPGLYGEEGRPIPAIRKLLDGGAAVLGADLLYQGSSWRGKPLGDPKVGNNREFAAYPFGYNHTVFASRVHDILTLLAFVRGTRRTRPGRWPWWGRGAGPLAPRRGARSRTWSTRLLSVPAVSPSSTSSTTVTPVPARSRQVR